MYTDHKFLRSVTNANPSIDKRLWITSKKRFEYVSTTSSDRVYKNSLTYDTSLKHLEDVLKMHDQDKYVGLDRDVLKMS